MNDRHPNLLPALAALALFVATAALFWPSVSYSLVNFDDPVFITRNPIVADGFSWRSVPRAFTALHGDKLMYNPVLWLSYLADTALFHATPAHPWGFHLTNVLLHAANAVLLYFILLAAVRRPGLALFAAAFWALHPLRVESVAWVTERKDTLSTFFALASILLYLKAWGRGRPARDSGPGAQPPPPSFHFSLFTFHCGKGYQCLALLAFAAGLLSKPMLVTLPFLFLLLDYWPLRRFALRDAPRALPRLAVGKWPYFLLSLVFALLTRALQTDAVTPFSLLQRLYWLPSNYFFYLAKTVWPVALIPMNPGLPVTPAFIAGVSVLLLGLAVLAGALLRRCPGFAVGLAAFAGLLFPVSGIVFIGHHPVADRYTYLPAIGLSLALLALLDILLPGRGRHARAACSVAKPPTSCQTQLCIVHCALCILPAALAAVTARILPTWKDTPALYARIAAFAPDHFAVLAHRFHHAFFVRGDVAEAAGLADRMVSLRPGSAQSDYAKVLTLSQTRTSREALDFHAAHLPPLPALRQHHSLPLLLAVLATDAGDTGAAAYNLRLARDASPGDAASDAAIDNIGRWLDAVSGRAPLPPEDLLRPATAVWYLGACAQALPSLLGIARAAPSNPALLNNVAWLLATTAGSPASPGDVLAIARQALALSPDHPVIRDTLAVALAYAGDFDTAIAIDTAVADFLRTSTASDAPHMLANVEKRLSLFRTRTPYTENSPALLLHAP
ncbi:MAG: hypothetical protein IKO01_01780 [Kiritimatiellae bacterium]|nr:hypothetical protein [Kiritimatiellia bacterium]